MEERSLEIGEVELAVAEAGSGGRPLLLLHGFTGAKEDFTEWLNPLAEEGWHAVAPDHRGHGSSSKPEEEDAYSFEILADDALALADALGWDRFVLLGHSMGGMVAQLVVMKATERVSALVLMDTGHGPVEALDPSMVDAALSIVRSQGIDALADAMASSSSPLETPSFRRLLEQRPGYAEFNDRKFRATSPYLYPPLASAFVHTADRLEDLGRLPPTLPALVVVGEEDQPFLGPSRRMADSIPGASLAVVPQAGHSPQFENPDAWWSALSGFLADLPH